MLHYVRKTVPFYNGNNSVLLSDFPIVNKNIMKQNIDLFISSSFDRNKLFHTTTSGSTGIPFTIFKDKRKLQRHKADVIYYNSLAQCELGQKVYYFRVWNEHNKKSKIQSFSENLIMVDSSDLSQASVEQIINDISKDKAPKVFLGFASSFTMLAKYLKGKKLDDLCLKSIITMSEALPEDARVDLMDIFHCNVVSRYSNMENGMLAMQVDSTKSDYELNRASYIIEILSFDCDTPVEMGESGRIVVTDLFNYAMPFIRYDTGDVGSISMEGNKSVLKTISGRRTDTIQSTSGHVLSSHVITNTMWKFDKVRQFQFIQESAKDYILLLNTEDKTHELSDNIILCLKEYIGADANIKTEYVDDIPLLSSGKRRYVINNYN